jgi:plasmid stabilization system protein ParE
MKHVVKILPRAEADIERNAQWWADHHSVDQAVKWFFAVRSQILSLDEFPESHSLSYENDEFPYEIREKLVGLGSRPSYRAVFTIRDGTVFVVALLAAEQDRLQPDDVQL